MGLFLLLAFGFAGYARDLLIQKSMDHNLQHRGSFTVILYRCPAREPDDFDCDPLLSTVMPSAYLAVCSVRRLWAGWKRQGRRQYHMVSS